MRGGLLLSLCLVAWPAPSWAQTEEQPAKTLQMSLDEDYRQRPEESHPGSLKGGALAFFPGFLAHGIGHIFIDEDTAGYWLLGAGALGLGLFAVDGVIERNLGTGTGPSFARRIIGHEALVLFLGSWLADMAGTLKGSAPFAESITPLRRSTYGVAYRFVDNATHTFYHHLRADLDVNWRRLYLRADLDLEVSLDFRGVGLELGGQVFRGRNRRNVVAVGVSMRREEDRRHGVAVSQMLPYVEWQADLGALIRTLRNLYAVSRMGYGLSAYQFSPTASSVPALISDHDFLDQWLFLETGFVLNLAGWTRLGVFIAMDPSIDVVPAQTNLFGQRLSEVQLVRLEFEHRQLRLELAAGAGTSLNIGLVFDL
jgi:hypothetical protein